MLTSAMPAIQAVMRASLSSQPEGRFSFVSLICSPGDAGGVSGWSSTRSRRSAHVFVEARQLGLAQVLAGDGGSGGAHGVAIHGIDLDAAGDDRFARLALRTVPQAARIGHRSRGC